MPCCLGIRQKPVKADHCVLQVRLPLSFLPALPTWNIGWHPAHKQVVLVLHGTAGALRDVDARDGTAGTAIATRAQD